MKYILIFLYIAINLLLLMLNLELFTKPFDLDLGFGLYETYPLIMLQIIGLIALILFAIFDGIKDLKRELKLTNLQKSIIQLEKDLEIEKFKFNNQKNVVATENQETTI